ncbi:MAG: hypothetical protein OXC99_02925 [Chloroflexi bacterium]|nr:hypothetical protein [Chloroflexota bacterium]
MTKDEEHQIIGRIVSDLADARKHAVCLEEKATNIAKELRNVASWLEGNRPVGALFNEHLTLTDAVELIVKVDHAKAEVKRLEDRRRELGV